MKTFFYTIGITLLIMGMQSCSFNAIKGNGNITVNEVNIAEYKEIEFSGGCNMVYEQNTDAAPYLRIETDENIYPLLTIESKDGKLSIGSKENINPTKCDIYTNSTGLTRISASGAMKAHIKGKLETTDLKLSVSGSGNFTIDSLTAHSIKYKASGSASLNVLGGKVNQLESTISGSGKTETLGLIADTVQCSVSGSGNFSVYAEKILNVKVSGSGNVRYKGNAQVDQSISGAGKVIKVE
ncbi:head GIN domain-containing protein [Prevotella sp. 10(H)]|uniref:head GIN domain-containing protein n=1 Tax=Prevotella sp. 10(H) TaxID=1158294 RepID=UPI0004A6E053|nr:head GIN domain-containing protein [Prevotella sp. 10(H)]